MVNADKGAGVFLGSERSHRKVATIMDVALDAGVSSMTVSRVINGEANVREDTRARVEDSIRKLRYRPNIGARRLAGARVARICLLYGNPSSAYLGELLMGALDAAAKMGHQLIVARPDEGDLIERISAGMLVKWDGLIAPSPIGDRPEIRRLVSETRFPSVFLTGASGKAGETGPAVNEIRIDNHNAARTMTQLLIDAGHVRIGFVRGPTPHGASARRYDGYYTAMQEAGLVVTPDMIERGDYTYRSGMEAASRLLARPDRPTAIFAGNDDMAAGVLAAAAQLGLRTPQDLSVTGFDDSPIATTVWPQLTTIRQPVAEMAASAVRLLDEIIWRRPSDVSQQPTRQIVPYSVILRDSVAPPG